MFLCICVEKRRRREKPAATSIGEIDSRWDKLFIPRDKFSDKTVGSRMLLTSNGIFMSPGEIERRTTSPSSGPIAQSAERKTRTRKLDGKQRANKLRGCGRGELAREKTGVPATFSNESP